MTSAVFGAEDEEAPVAAGPDRHVLTPAHLLLWLLMAHSFMAMPILHPALLFEVMSREQLYRAYYMGLSLNLLLSFLRLLTCTNHKSAEELQQTITDTTDEACCCLMLFCHLCGCAN